jgi:hypothetical protein
VVKPGANGAPTAYASWNGATGVAAWRLVGGAVASELTPLLSVPSTGFETAIGIPAGPAYVAVQAFGADGSLLGSSLVAAG